jgi:hypothetical protein
MTAFSAQQLTRQILIARSGIRRDAARMALVELMLKQTL